MELKGLEVEIIEVCVRLNSSPCVPAKGLATFWSWKAGFEAGASFKLDSM